jgi:hypothetical protein
VTQILSAVEELSKGESLNIRERYGKRSEDRISVVGYRAIQIK